MQPALLQAKRIRFALLLATTLVALVTLVVTFRNAYESSPGGHVAGEAKISETNAASHITARKPISLTVDSLSPELSIQPGSISRALSNSWRPPNGIPERDVLSAREKDILQLLLAQGSPSNRVAHLSILESVGGDSSATALIHMLTDEFSACCPMSFQVRNSPMTISMPCAAQFSRWAAFRLARHWQRTSWNRPFMRTSGLNPEHGRSKDDRNCRRLNCA